MRRSAAARRRSPSLEITAHRSNEGILTPSLLQAQNRLIEIAQTPTFFAGGLWEFPSAQTFCTRYGCNRLSIFPYSGPYLAREWSPFSRWQIQT